MRRQIKSDFPNSELKARPMIVTDQMLIAAQTADHAAGHTIPGWRPVPGAQLARLIQAAVDNGESQPQP